MIKKQAIIQQTKQGNTAVFDAFYLSLRPKFIHWARKNYKKEKNEAIELFQQSMLITYENILTGKADDLSSSLETYVFGIAKNNIRNANRTFLVQEKHQEKLSQHYLLLSQDELDANMQQVQLIQLVKQVFPLLKTGCQDILKRFYFEEKKAQVIAQELGLSSEQVVRTQKSRCLKYLKQLLAEKQAKKVIMMNQEDRIEQYLKGALPPSEKQAFEKELASNPSLKKKFAEEQAVMIGIKEYFQEQALNRFHALEQQAKKKDNITILVKWSSLLVAASLLLFFYFNNPFQDTSNTTLYASYYSTYPNYAENVERSDPANKITYENAFFAYEQQNYKQAIEAFKTLNNTQDPVFEFYWGLSLLELKEYKEALLHLEQAARAPQHRYSDNALWYQALTYLQLENYSKVETTLQELITNESTYKAKAITILEAVQELKS